MTLVNQQKWSTIMKQDIFNFPLSIESEHSPAKIHYQIGEFQNKKSCALVIPTNCDGEARFGLLAEVNANFSYNQQIYQAACANHSMHIGDILSVKNTEGASQGPYFLKGNAVLLSQTGKDTQLNPKRSTSTTKASRLAERFSNVSSSSQCCLTTALIMK